VLDIVARVPEAKPATTVISVCSICFLVFSQQILEPWLNGVFELPIPYELILVGKKMR
jgi:hypothetical protein